MHDVTPTAGTSGQPRSGLVVAAVAGALAAVVSVAIVVGWLALRDETPGSGSAVGVAVSTDDTTDSSTPSDESTSTTASTASTTTTEPVESTTTSEASVTTVSTTAPSGLVECTSGQYTLVVPEGWHHDGCTQFSQSALERPLPANLRPEIDIAWVTSETFDDALVRVRDRFDVQRETQGVEGGRDAVVFVLSESGPGGRTGERTVYVVDAPDGVFFASANELVTAVPLSGPRIEHYEDSLAALEQMLASITF